MVKTNGSAGYAGAGYVFIYFLGGVLLWGMWRYNILNFTPKKRYSICILATVFSGPKGHRGSNSHGAGLLE